MSLYSEGSYRVPQRPRKFLFAGTRHGLAWFNDSEGMVQKHRREPPSGNRPPEVITEPGEAGGARSHEAGRSEDSGGGCRVGHRSGEADEEAGATVEVRVEARADCWSGAGPVLARILPRGARAGSSVTSGRARVLASRHTGAKTRQRIGFPGPGLGPRDPGRTRTQGQGAGANPHGTGARRWSPCIPLPSRLLLVTGRIHGIMPRWPGAQGMGKPPVQRPGSVEAIVPSSRIEARSTAGGPE